MEKLKDILNNIKDRFSNPLVFSFVCSWLVINWQITVGLLWYDPVQISKTGCNSIFEFISDKLNPTDCLYHPFLFALAYTIAMPTIKNLIRALYSWTAKWGDNWNLHITKGVKIPFEKYLKFREDYDKRSKILEDIISKESSNQTKYNQTKTELLQSQAIVNDLQQRVTNANEFVSQLYDITILSGYWINKYADTINKKLTNNEEVFIDGEKYYIVEKFGEKKHAFNIRNFHFDNRTKTIFFIKERVNQDEAVIIQGSNTLLRFNPNALHMERSDLLIGQENGTTQIEYRKKEVSSTVDKDKK